MRYLPVFSKFSPNRLQKSFLVAKGIASGDTAYKGPGVIQLDLTDGCNNKCIMCWLHSPLLTSAASSSYEELDFDVSCNFLCEAQKMGAESVILSGGGEPFFYPKIWRIMEKLEDLGLYFHLKSEIQFHFIDITLEMLEDIFMESVNVDVKQKSLNC